MENKFEINNKVAFITILKKNGEELTAKVDVEDLNKVKESGTWFAEWNKDLNSYTVQNISLTKVNKKSKPLKQSLQSIILDTNPRTPIRHINGDTLDNRRSNLEIVERNIKNDYEVVNDDTIAILLRDKYGKVQNKALISKEDLRKVVTDTYTWVLHKNYDNFCVIANTPNGRIHLDRVLMNPDENQTVHHINLNPLDNRRSNLEITSI
ncbi:hypothetical protein FDB55_07090 [Clostridium botulinum]|uniref:HNH endonuclease n=1 Tax=Clostridium botulinum TaxID=1491 RepID=A0A0C2SF13_CLOBO|nr:MULTISPECIES: hypothetical protein [Clostridium]ACD51697.1 hypothetical protein CLH_2776 [Clostridium botulinum E3 str. Alaska E43]AJF30597.1 hypothetical protein ST13_13090 [Clostridium botulinum]AJF33660.1 hypothetical protein ST12_13090 [Clostridium botulinum]EES50629.1 hypothetical protein CLO_0591 [Clostridium botulinum E1 str. 'BoNT E Beluga']KAI3349334.1 hypothetical protein CIT18_08690 [Clostridium botulinum]